ncbi:hypothetical protein SEA_RASPUTIA_35 [Microbacterium phage Rasputia]|nr:hypothetical protein SEA_RASPUTIA_35 [Microbacterium phage Rasputia]
MTTDEVDYSDIRYDDADTLRSVLIGQKIVEIGETTGEAIEQAKHDLEHEKWEAGGKIGPEPWKSHSYNRDEYDRVLLFRLSGGMTLRAHAHDGGCGCSNGCFTVDIAEEVRAKLLGATILSVEVEERNLDYRRLTPEDPGYDAEKDAASRIGQWAYVEGDLRGPDSSDDDSARIRVFVYTDLVPERQPLVTSEGGDNGYYGWGFHWSVDRTITITETGKRLELS